MHPAALIGNEARGIRRMFTICPLADSSETRISMSSVRSATFESLRGPVARCRLAPKRHAHSPESEFTNAKSCRYLQKERWPFSNPANGLASFAKCDCQPCGKRTTDFAAMVGRQSREGRLHFAQQTVMFVSGDAGRVAGEDGCAVRALTEAGRVGLDDFGDEAGVQEHLRQRFQCRPERPVGQARQRILKSHLVPIRAVVTVHRAGDGIGPAKVRVEIDHIADFLSRARSSHGLGRW